jgi:serine/threonine-protein kinase
LEPNLPLPRPPVAAPPIPQIPGYQVLGVCGRGGMGVVYRARQLNLDRFVALKMIHGLNAPPESLARFRAEAQAVARLHHPNIVQIYDIGEHSGQPFFTLEYVDGGSLASRLRRTSLTPRQAAQLTETLAQAVHHAHQQGIIHRDLKPANVLLTKDNVPKITDFGLAKRLEEFAGDGSGKGSSLTGSGEVLGTPSFMAPEQAAGMKRRIGPATDVYALGAMLYQLLTGRPPFDADTPMQTMLQVLHDEPVPPRQLQPKVPRDLQTICLKCLEKAVEQRYSDAAALANDLHAFLSGEPILARPVSRGERVARWVQQRPLVAVGGGLALVMLVGLLVGAFFYSAAAVAAVAAASAVAAGCWYGVRLRAALHRISTQHLLLERGIERQHLLLETTQRLMKTTNLDELLRLLSEATTELVNAERATVYLLDKDKQELWSRLALGEDVGEIRVTLGSGIAGTVAKTGEVINIADPYADPRFNPDIDRRTGYRTSNLLTLPMHADNGRIIGVFQVLNKRAGSFDSDDVELLQSLARCAAAIVEKEKRNRV